MPISLFEGRRPGLSAIYNELAIKNPTWSHQQLLSEAKQEWYRRHPQ